MEVTMGLQRWACWLLWGMFILRMLWEVACTQCLDDPGSRTARSGRQWPSIGYSRLTVTTCLHPAGQTGPGCCTPLRSSTMFLDNRCFKCQIHKWDNHRYRVAHLPFGFFSFHAPLFWSTKYVNRGHWFSKGHIHALYSSAPLQPGVLFIPGGNWIIIPQVFGQGCKNIPAHTLTPVPAFSEIDLNSPYPVLHGR